MVQVDKAADILSRMASEINNKQKHAIHSTYLDSFFLDTRGSNIDLIAVGENKSFICRHRTPETHSIFYGLKKMYSICSHRYEIYVSAVMKHIAAGLADAGTSNIKCY